jgi:hypothetical protein
MQSLDRPSLRPHLTDEEIDRLEELLVQRLDLSTEADPDLAAHLDSQIASLLGTRKPQLWNLVQQRPSDA